MKNYAFTCLFFVVSTTLSTPAIATDFFVSPNGNDSNNGTSDDNPLQSIQVAVDKAKAGDTITLAAGTYRQDFVTRTAGTEGQPITITGSDDAVVKGAGKARVIQISHSYVVLNGFTIDGLHGKSESADGYRDKLIYVQGQSGVEGLKITNMQLKNAKGECVRLRDSQSAEVAFNQIEKCGIEDFQFGGMKGKNGEGVYIGTAPEQLTDGLDQSSDNWVHHNTIDTQGNECVDIKEGATNNMIENNYCTGQLDPNSGGLDSRGNNNTFRYNQVFGNKGAGVRLGGDTSSDGSNNAVYGNTIYDNAGGGIKFQAKPQGQICGNTMNNNAGGNAVGSFGSLFSPTADCLK